MEAKTEFCVIAKAERNILILFHKYIITKDEPQARKVSKPGVECRNNMEESCFGRQEYFKGHKLCLFKRKMQIPL